VIAREEHGAGPSLVLLHGGTETARSQWSDAIPVFARHFRVIAPDLPGHGGSPLGAPFSYPSLATEIAAFLDELAVERAAFYGFSDGANIALELAIRRADLVRTLVLSGIAFRYTDAYRTAVRAFLAGVELAEPLRTEIPRLWLDGEPRLSREDLARVTAPALVLTGDRDEFFPVEDTVALHRLLPSSELCVLPGEGHGWGEPFTAAALAFLLRQSASE
jgi:pimeloyl-ACP methyl ester carboxylesterase